VEDLAGRTLVNGHPIEGRVEVEYPVSVQIGEVTLVVEVKGATATEEELRPDPSVAVTIPQRGVRQSATHLDVTIPQRALREAEQRRTESAAASAQNEAPLTGKYTLVREIARGGMGQIYFGEDPQLERQVVVQVTWEKAREFCQWLSSKTGKEWRLPTNAEWDAAVGNSTYPWGDYFPPHWDDGNYSVLEDGKDDPKGLGGDGILGTAPVGSFKPNVLGFYDLGGNVWEWTWDGPNKDGRCALRGAGWRGNIGLSRTAHRWLSDPKTIDPGFGLRLVRKSVP